MNLREAYTQQFGFAPPEDYLRLTDDTDQVLWPLLPELHWLTAADVLAFEFEEHQWPDFVPFARSVEGNLWCWCPGEATGGEVPAGFCPLNCEEGEIYAPDFSRTLFRLICEAAQHYSSTAEFLDLARTLLNNAAACPRTNWPIAWRNWMTDMAASPVASWRTQDGIVSGIPSRAEMEWVMREWIDDGQVGVVFRWMTMP